MEAVPPFEEFFRPLLALSANGEISVRKSADEIADQLGLTTEARLEMTRGGNAQKYIDRTYWTATYLRQAELLVSSGRGRVTITDAGKKFLTKHPEKITQADLNEIQSFVDFKNRKKEKSAPKKQTEITLVSNLTPEDRISEALEEIEQDLTAQLLSRLLEAPPAFFEKVVIDLLISMGYGGSQTNAGRVVGKSGDDGIDGVIDQDALGLDRVYVQAKRHKNTVSAGAIRDFTGSLEYHQANKGMFITTSTFSDSAARTAERVAKRIVLIDGQKLAALMLENSIGCLTKKSISLMRMDEDYFPN